MRRLVQFSAIVALLVGCGDGTLVVDDNPHGVDGMESANNSPSTTTTGDTQTSSPTPSNSSNPTPMPSNNTMPDPAPTNNGTMGDTNNSGTNNMTMAPTNNTTPAEQFHPMYVAVADFMREKCVNCHDQGQNGNIVVPSAMVSNAELRVNLEGVVATTGRLLIEPNDPAESQVYIMITNAAGEQFPPETIAIVEDWINAGAPYDP